MGFNAETNRCIRASIGLSLFYVLYVKVFLLLSILTNLFLCFQIIFV